MDKTISAAEANRKFSQLLQSVRRGRNFVVTSHGKPVARIMPIEETGKMENGARDSLLVRLKRQAVIKADAWTRDELYEDAE